MSDRFDYATAAGAPPAAAGEWGFPGEWFGPRLALWLDSEKATPWADPEVPNPTALRLLLSRRDVQVLQLLASGEGTAEIANQLAYSESMIKHVIHRVVTGIGARNRAHAIAIAIRAGII